MADVLVTNHKRVLTETLNSHEGWLHAGLLKNLTALYYSDAGGTWRHRLRVVAVP